MNGGCWYFDFISPFSYLQLRRVRGWTGRVAITPVPVALGVDDVEAATAAAEVKNALRRNTEGALAAGVFGVPTLRLGEELFWGNDANAMIEDRLADPRIFDGAEYRRIAALPVGVERPR
jgi:2-hydroxychromene-2-carboxylate isomerase